MVIKVDQPWGCIRAGFEPSSGQTWAHFEPTSTRLQADFGRLRADLVRLRGEFGLTLTDPGKTMSQLWVSFAMSLGGLWANFGRTLNRLKAHFEPALSQL